MWENLLVDITYKTSNSNDFNTALIKLSGLD